MHRRLLNGDTGLSLLLLAVGLFWAISAVPYGLWQGFGPRPGFMPLIYGLLLVGLSSAILVQQFLAAPDAPDQQEPIGKPLMILGSVALALLGLETAGFGPSIFVSLLLLLLVVERRTWLASLLVSAAVPACLILLFHYFLGVPLPAGPLGI